jgi:hypothetical protein
MPGAVVLSCMAQMWSCSLFCSSSLPVYQCLHQLSYACSLHSSSASPGHTADQCHRYSLTAVMLFQEELIRWQGSWYA